MWYDDPMTLRRVWQYGPSNFERTHMLVLNSTWELP